MNASFGWVDRFEQRAQALLSPAAMRTLKRIEARVFPARRARRDVAKLRRRMLNLGFAERGEADLIKWANDAGWRWRRRLAAVELAAWYLNRAGGQGATDSLPYLDIAAAGNRDRDLARQVAIMAAEARLRLDQRESAREVLDRAMRGRAHVDLFLARANLEPEPQGKTYWINKALHRFGLQPVSITSDAGPLYDRLAGSAAPASPGRARSREAPLITVIMPAFDAERCIATAIESVLAQTWERLELLVVDDCSGDATVRIVRQYCERDPRVRLIEAPSNAGPYVARNLALRQAAGELVTCNDADDWSHPQKLARQAGHLLGNPGIVGNLSQQARATDQLDFHRRGYPGYYCSSNMSSFMFRRAPVTSELGHWDSVRFGADSELVRRARVVFGDTSVAYLDTGPLSFQRQTSDSLTGSELFGYHGYFMGARREYFESHEHYHRSGHSLKYDFPQRDRPFAAPAIMLPAQEKRGHGRRHFDVIIASDFRLHGGSTISSLEEVKAQHEMGLRTGLVQMSRYDYDARAKTAGPVRELLNAGKAEMIVYGDTVSCDLLIVRYPPVLRDRQRFLPDIRAGHVRVIVNQTPFSHYGPRGVLRYEIPRCAANLRDELGKDAVWSPIGPQVRRALHEHHAADLGEVVLSSEDWVNIIDTAEWQRPAGSGRRDRPRIGRHSRDNDMKWPAAAAEIARLYPENERFEVWVLGGADTPRKRLGRLPRNWRVFEFGAMRPAAFLQEIDVFVYFTHPEWVEPFGRSVLEAMAAGVPVVLPPQYEPLFGAAAVYAEPADAPAAIERLLLDDGHREEQVRRGRRCAEREFGYTRHAERLAPYVRATGSRIGAATV